MPHRPRKAKQRFRTVDLIQLRLPKARATASSPLFRVPPEIRLEIYKLLLVCPVNLIRADKAIPSYSKVQSITMFLVCRFIHNETRSIFYASNTFRISAYSPFVFLGSRSTRSDTRYTRSELIHAVSLDIIYQSSTYHMVERQISQGRTMTELFELLPALAYLTFHFSDRTVRRPDRRLPCVKYSNMISILKDNIRGLKKATVTGLQDETMTRSLETIMMQPRRLAGSKPSSKRSPT